MSKEKGSLSIHSENIFPIIKKMALFRSRHFYA